MSSQTMPQRTQSRVPSTARRGAPGVTQSRVLHGEWIKLASLRSTYLIAGLAAIVIVGLGVALSISDAGVRSGSAHQQHLPPDVPLQGVIFAQLFIGVLGVLTVTSEYHSGMIRATFAAVPRRVPVLWAKAGLVAGIAFVTGIVAGTISFLVAMAAMPHGVTLSLGRQGALLDLLGIGLYLAVVALIAAGIGYVVRSTAGALATVFGIILVLPIVGQMLPSHLGERVNPYLPTNAGVRVMDIEMTMHTLGRWAGFVVFCCYAAAALGIGLALLRRRDA